MLSRRCRANELCSTTSYVRPSFFPTPYSQLTPDSLLNPVTIYKADPDVIVGHEFLGVSLDVLLKRMRDLKADHWSRIGRFRRSKWPNIGRQGTNLKFLNGRLVCDLASDSAKVSVSTSHPYLLDAD